MESQKCCCSQKTTERSNEEIKALQNRLKRLEGQIRGIEKMLEDNAYCMDILTQCLAASSAIKSFSREVLNRHLKTCVKEGLLEQDDTVLDELTIFMQKWMS